MYMNLKKTNEEIFKNTIIKEIKKNSESTFTENEININDLEIINKFIDDKLMEYKKDVISFLIDKRKITTDLRDIISHIIDDYEIVYQFKDQKLVLRDFIRTKDKYNGATNPYYHEYVHYIDVSYFL